MPTSRFVLPEYASKGKARLWRDPVVESIVDRMHNGDASLGWAGDERLGLYFGTKAPNEGRWLVIRHAEDGQEYIVCRAKPGASLMGLIPFLAENDTRRRGGADMIAALDADDRRRASETYNAERAAAEHFASQATRRRAPLGRRRTN